VNPKQNDNSLFKRKNLILTNKDNLKMNNILKSNIKLNNNKKYNAYNTINYNNYSSINERLIPLPHSLENSINKKSKEKTIIPKKKSICQKFRDNPQHFYTVELTESMIKDIIKIKNNK
jgi:hypothetical protein